MFAQVRIPFLNIVLNVRTAYKTVHMVIVSSNNVHTSHGRSCVLYRFLLDIISVVYVLYGKVCHYINRYTHYIGFSEVVFYWGAMYSGDCTSIGIPVVVYTRMSWYTFPYEF